VLQSSGWRASPPLTSTSWLNWLNPQSQLALLPVLPQVHAGNYESLRLVHPLEGGEVWQTLRLWSSGYQLADGRPLWIGNLSLLAPRQRGLLTVPVTQGDFTRPWREFPRTLEGVKMVERQDDAGRVLLIEAAGGYSPLR
jgi:undecaprenyl-diphosphatase